MYGLMLAISILAGYLFIKHQMLRRFALAEHVVGIFILLMIVGSLIGARLFALIFEMNVPLAQIPGYLIRPQPAGVTFFGGFLLALLIFTCFVWYYRINFWEMGDILVVPTAFGLGLTRVGCFLAGCCWGHPTDLPWAVYFTHPEAITPLKFIPCHPAQLYHSATNFAIFGLLLIVYYRWRSRPRGLIFVLFLTLYAVGRFVTEFFRGDAYRGFVWDGISSAQFISLFVFSAGLVGIMTLLRHKHRVLP